MFGTTRAVSGNKEMFCPKRSFPLITMLIVITALMLLSALLSVLIIKRYINMVNSDSTHLLSLAADSYSDVVETRLNNYSTGMELIALNQTVRDNIFRTDVTRTEMVDLGNTLKKTIDSLTYFFYQSGELYSHKIYTHLPGNGAYFSSLDSITSTWWYQKMTGNNLSELYWYSYSVIAHSNQLNIAEAMNNFGTASSEQNSETCYQTITVNLNQLFLPETQTFLGQEAEIYAFDNLDHTQIYASASHEEEANQLYQEMMAGYDDQETPVKIRDNNHKAFTVLSRSLSDPDITVVLLFSPYHLTVQGYFSEIISIAAITLLFFLLLLILLLFYSNYHQRLDYIISTIDHFNEQKPKNHPPLYGNDEIARIDRHLIKMQNRIQVLIQEKYAVKMQKISAQLEALAVCVNPHFLYNTLNSISAMACMEGAERSVEMISALSGMFRYSCDTSEKFVSLQAELKNISDYLYIQKIRYQDSLNCQVQIPEEYYGIRVPKLILQPIVENAFKHGFQFSSAETKELDITAETSEETLFFRIRDNGCGMSAETLEKLREELKQDEFVGESVRIGLYSVNSRIRLLCGQEYGVAVTSEADRFTMVELSLPCKIQDRAALLSANSDNP